MVRPETQPQVGRLPRSSGDSEEGRAFYQERMAFFGKVGSLIVLVTYVYLNLAGLHDLSPSWRDWLTPDDRIHLATAAVLAFVWLACRKGARSMAALAAIDASGSTLACLGAALPLWLPEASVDFKYRTLLVITNALIARAAVVPSSPRRTFWISAAAAAPAAYAVHAFHLRAPSGSTFFPTALALSWCVVAVAIATITSGVIYGLRLKVREARQLGQYTLQEKLGEGGMGEVYRASHALLRRPTAVKLLLPERAGQAGLKRFEREVQLTSLLTHPNTVAIFDYGHTPDGVFYYAMEYLEGVNLEDLIRENGPQPPARVAHILRQLCGALSEAHAIGLIHRDVKPSNVILCQRGGMADVAKVFDFGLVRHVQGEAGQSLTGDNMIAGTPLFLSPEAITSPDAVDARSDLYALGAVAYYLLTGRYVFEGKTLVETCSHHLHSTPVPPSERLGRPLPPSLEALILRCLQKDPSRRPQSARELQETLARSDDVGAWSEEEARVWWSRRAERRGGRAGSGPPPPATDQDLSQALTVDLSERGRRAKTSPD